jgi:lipopolysaccharide/colanic/teichoic acid biosynthesis glycosyltransferase
MGNKKKNSGKKKNVTVNKTMQKNQNVTAQAEKAAKTASKPKNDAPKKSFAQVLKPVADFFKKNITMDILVVFAIFVLALILVGALGLKEPVVPVCLALILEVGIAVMLHNAEVWVHGAAVVVQLIAGVLIARAGMMILCIVLYVLAIAALQLLEKNGKHLKQI